MKLRSVRISNFRCYGQEVRVDFDDITALVGANDSGKSSILDALDIFLSEGAPDCEDGSKHGNPADLTIACEFSDLPAEVVLDDQTPTSLVSEYLLNSGGRLEIQKTYSGNLKSPKVSSVCARAQHPTAAGVADLLQLKNQDLKKRAKDLSVDLSSIDQRCNAAIRSAVRAAVGDLKVGPVSVSLTAENGRDVWNAIRSYLPTFALFKSDRQSTDQDPEAQDPLKATIAAALKGSEQVLQSITDRVEVAVTQTARRTLEKLREMDPCLASELTPHLSAPKWENLFKATIVGDAGIPVNKRGSGDRRLILLSFFRAQAEAPPEDDAAHEVIYGIEEPETSQHPRNQRMLLKAFTDLSGQSQVILTTHTPMLARALPDHSLRYIEARNDGSRVVHTGGPSTNQLFAESLGVLPDNGVRLFVGVEGKHDITFLQTMSRNLIRDGHDVLDLVAMEIAGELIFFPLGGSNLALWTSRLENLHRPEFHLFDRDVAPPTPAKCQAELDAINGRCNCIARCTTKRELESYIHPAAIEEAYRALATPITLPGRFNDFDDVPRIVAAAVHSASGSTRAFGDLDEEAQKEKESRAKRILNKEAVAVMTREQLEEVDPEGVVLSWFHDMKSLIAEV